jgi:hypothetical protein
VDIKFLLIDFIVYLICIYILMRKIIKKYLSLNKFLIPLIILSIIIILFYSVCLFDPRFQSIYYKTDFSTIKIKFGFICS